MRVEIEDLRRVVKRAERAGKHVVVGGHSLGGTITTAYATWDFGGRPGARGLSGLVFIDGGSSRQPIAKKADAEQRLADLNAGSPWLSFGGIPAPFAGLFNSTGSLGALIDPNSPSLGQAWSVLPANLKPPMPATNRGAVRVRARHGDLAARRWPRLRRTSATSRRAATRAAGTTRAS